MVKKYTSVLFLHALRSSPYIQRKLSEVVPKPYETAPNTRSYKSYFLKHNIIISTCTDGHRLFEGLWSLLQWHVTTILEEKLGEGDKDKWLRSAAADSTWSTTIVEEKSAKGDKDNMTR